MVVIKFIKVLPGIFAAYKDILFVVDDRRNGILGPHILLQCKVVREMPVLEITDPADLVVVLNRNIVGVVMIEIYVCHHRKGPGITITATDGPGKLIHRLF